MIRATTRYITQNGNKMQQYTATVEGETYTEIFDKERKTWKQLTMENEYVIKTFTTFSYK